MEVTERRSRCMNKNMVVAFTIQILGSGREFVTRQCTEAVKVKRAVLRRSRKR